MGLFSFGGSSSAFSAADSPSGPTNGTAPLPFTCGASSAAPQKISGPFSSSGTPGIFTFSGTSSTNAVTTSSSIFNIGVNSTSSSTSAVNTSVPAPAPAPAPVVSFGQPSVSPSPGGFAFGSASSPFLFGSQQSQSAPQNSSPFAASSSLGQAAPQSSTFATSNSLEFGGGGSFSLGSSGPEKSGRRIVKVNRNKHKRK